MKTKTLDQIKTKYYGEIGTPERDRIERDLDALRIGLKIRTAREQKRDELRHNWPTESTKSARSFQRSKTTEGTLLSKRCSIL